MNIAQTSAPYPADRMHGLARIGIWLMEMRFSDAGQASEFAGELEGLGYGAVWIPGGVDGDS